MRHISVFGLGYVGAVTAACLASKGHYVLGVDLNGQKVQMLEQGHAPVLEPGLDELIAKSRAENRLHATQDPARAIHETEVSFVCVGTPNMRNGKLDLSAVERGCEEVGKALRTKKDFHWIVLRSTMLPGTAERLAIPTLEKASGKRVGEHFAVCVNPEFTREGCAVTDFLKPEMTVLGAADPKHFAILREIYEWVPGKVFETSLSAAEMVKYVCNIYHALKVSFANEIGTLCSQLGVDTKAVFDIFTSDTKLNISPAYLTPGFAFGGSCLPKDLRALTYRAKEVDLNLPLLHSVMPSNQAHIERAVEAVLHTEKKKVAVLGLSFKAGTDDLRESPLVQLIKRLLGEGCQIQIWDPFVSLGKLTGSNRDFIESVIPHIGSLLREDMKEVVQFAEVVLIGSKVAAREELQSCLKKDQIVIDVASISGPVPIKNGVPHRPGVALSSLTH
jgi:GDP-mannose 6-dehydrogenase